MHIGHGSQVVNNSQPLSSKFLTDWQAVRIATISACAVGSRVAVTRFTPAAMIAPSLTTTAANGPPADERTFSSESAIALCMNGFTDRSLFMTTIAESS